MYHDYTYGGLPDPQRDAQFYDGVPQRRLIAWLIDTMITGLASLVVLVGTFGLAMFIMPLVWVALAGAYRFVTIRASSSTIGMRMAAIELRDRQGHRFDATTAALHTGLYIIANILFPLQILSCFLMYTSRYGQGLHDMVLGTTAINTPANY